MSANAVKRSTGKRAVLFTSVLLFAAVGLGALEGAAAEAPNTATPAAEQPLLGTRGITNGIVVLETRPSATGNVSQWVFDAELL